MQYILDERDETERRYLALQESTRGQGKAHDDTVELLRLASIGRPSVGSRSVAKLTEQQLALGMSDEKLNANEHPQPFKDCHYWLGRLAEEAKDLTTAETHYLEILGLDYSYKDVSARLEKIQGELGQSGSGGLGDSEE